MEIHFFHIRVPELQAVEIKVEQRDLLTVIEKKTAPKQVISSENSLLDSV